MTQEKHENQNQISPVDTSTTSTPEWHLNANDPKDKSKFCYPVRTGVSIEPLICGAEAFGAVYKAIRAATDSIEIATWGFDPSLRLNGSPRQLTSQKEPLIKPIDNEKNPRIGDLLREMAGKGVKVRVLVWQDSLARFKRVDENVPESGLTGDGMPLSFIQSLWGNDANMAKMADHARDALKEYNYRVHTYLDDYLDYAEGGLIIDGYFERSAKERKGKRTETMKSKRKGLQHIYGRGYPCPLYAMSLIDSPLCDLDDHLFNAQWFNDARSGNIPNLCLEYRGQNRAVHGGASYSMARLNALASRLQSLLERLETVEYYEPLATQITQKWVLFWGETEIGRKGPMFDENTIKGMVANWILDASQTLARRTGTVLGDIDLWPQFLKDLKKAIEKDLDLKKLELKKFAIHYIDAIAGIYDAWNDPALQITDTIVRHLAVTHHQKTVMVDYGTAGKAVGFVMGHNMLKDYMDDREHSMFNSEYRYPEFKPWQDISIKVRGEALIDIDDNFVEYWPGGAMPLGKRNFNSANLVPGGQAQILRTAFNPGGDSGSVPNVIPELDKLLAALEKACAEIEILVGRRNDIYAQKQQEFEQGINLYGDQWLKDHPADQWSAQVQTMAGDHGLTLPADKAEAIAKRLADKAGKAYTSASDKVSGAAGELADKAGTLTDQAGQVLNGAGVKLPGEDIAGAAGGIKEQVTAAAGAISEKAVDALPSAEQVTAATEGAIGTASEVLPGPLAAGATAAEIAKPLGGVGKSVGGLADAALGGEGSSTPGPAAADTSYLSPDKESIFRAYLKAIGNTTNFIYTENQYFRHTEIADAVLEHAKKRALEGVTEPLYWFVVTNHPVTAGEAPNTFLMLEKLGQRERLPKYARGFSDEEFLEYKQAQARVKSINTEILMMDIEYMPDGVYIPNIYTEKSREDRKAQLNAEKDAILKRIEELEEKYPSIANYGGKDPDDYLDNEDHKKVFQTKDTTVENLKDLMTKEELADLQLPSNHICLHVQVGTLTSCHQGEKACAYTPIYVHSKLLVVDDVFMTSGSANINKRSMHVDSEINISTASGETAMNLRKELFKQHAMDDQPDLDNPSNMKKNYSHWGATMDNNWRFMHKGKSLKGFLTHFYDAEVSVGKPTD